MWLSQNSILVTPRNKRHVKYQNYRPQTETRSNVSRYYLAIPPLPRGISPLLLRHKSACSLCFVHWRATRRVLASMWGLRVHFYTRRVLIFKAGITVILCLVFIFRRIRRGIFNILLPGVVPPPLATCLNILLEYISQYRRAVRADRNGIRIRFCENLLHSRGNTHASIHKNLDKRATTLLELQTHFGNK